MARPASEPRSEQGAEQPAPAGQEGGRHSQAQDDAEGRRKRGIAPERLELGRDSALDEALGYALGGLAFGRAGGPAGTDLVREQPDPAEQALAIMPGCRGVSG